ncbi:MAG TPA: succinate dehydrogenase, hydrophobic membrane anchor protein [Alphaproteobacteria bacterium]|jgi:succinate dehydrogenase / fumarate reductase membrane anchor subunit
MSFRTPIARARGLGSAKDGTAHWWAQRVTALALIPLTLWFAISVIGLVGGGHEAVVAWLSSPVAAGLMILLIATTFHHAQLGIQVVIEDYVHNEPVKIGAIILVKFVAVVLGLAGILAVLAIAFGG